MNEQLNILSNDVLLDYSIFLMSLSQPPVQWVPGISRG
jgi:hypothetical protein